VKTRENQLPSTDDAVLAPAAGAGPLLQRDYWCTLADCALAPSSLMDHVAAHFCEFPPGALVQFSFGAGAAELACGSAIDIHIRPGTNCRVRVIHRDANSFTFATLAGHPEAGRITFGAYRNPLGQVILHIRSRARSSSTGNRLGFLAIGDAMQTNTWADFINNAARSVGAQIAGAIHAEKRAVEETADDEEPLTAPTFIARGD
jgi:hypothetical protein